MAGVEPTWSERLAYRPSYSQVRMIIDGYGKRAAHERWGVSIVRSVLKDEEHRRRTARKKEPSATGGGEGAS